MYREPLEETYFVWLYSQVGEVEVADPARTYWRLLKKLHSTEFLWLLPRDDNRAADGRELRYEFMHDEGLEDIDPDWMELGCSMLELLIGLSRRLSFEGDGEPDSWFWELIENLGLEKYNDHTEMIDQEIDFVLKDVIFRTYRRSGKGGLFPLRKANKDQRNVEIWTQLNAYLREAC